MEPLFIFELILRHLPQSVNKDFLKVRKKRKKTAHPAAKAPPDARPGLVPANPYFF
jgi:hypothetical protein